MWQPIETAPKDGKTEVLLFGLWAGEIRGIDKSPEMGIGYRSNGRGDYEGFNWYGSRGDAYAEWCKPTHWMPLPQPPEAE